MNLKAIKNESDYEAALKKLETLFDAKPGTVQGDEAEVLVILIQDYEKMYFPIPEPDPIEAIRFRMEQMGMKQKDLARYVGSVSRASEILNRKRKLTLEMIKKLHLKFNIPYESLITKS